jgi:hypothetical protein
VASSDARDPMYALWLLSWDVRAATGSPLHIADGNIFYPHRGAAFYGDAVPALALFAAPVLFLTRNPVAAYNVLFLLSFVIAAHGMYLLVKRLTSSRNAAFVAGLIFAFFPYRFAHLGHLELLFCGWIPYCFLFIHRYFDAPSIRNMMGIAGFYILQVLSCAYYGEYMTFFVGLTALYYAARSGAFRRPRFWRDAGLAVALAAALLGPYFYAMLQVHRRMLFTRAMWEIKLYSAELQHYLAAPPINRVWGWLTGGLGAQEWQLFPGLVPIVLSLAWLFWKRGDVTRPAPLAVAPRARTAWGFRVWDAANAALFLFVVYLGIWGGRGVTVAGIWISTRTLKDPVAFLLLSLILRVISSPRARTRWRSAWGSLAAPEKTYSLIVAAAWLLSFGPVIRILGREIITGPYAFFFDWVPGFRNVRVPSRFAVMFMLGLSVMSGWGVLRIAGRRKTAKSATVAGAPGFARGSSSAAKAHPTTLIAGVAAALVIIESLAIPIPLSPVPVGDRIPAIYADVARLPESAVLIELPMPARDSDESDEAAAVYFSSYHRRRIVNGYSGNAPPGYRVVREAMETFPSEATLSLLRDLGVDHVLVHGRGYRAPKGEEMLRGLETFDAFVDPVAERDGDHLVRLKLPPTVPGPPGESFRPVGDSKKWSAVATLNPTDARLAFDGDPATGWSTGYPQRTGDSFEIDFGESLDFRKIELRLGTNPLDYPRDFIVESSADGRVWSRLSGRKGFFPPVDLRTIEDVLKYAVPIPVAPTTARKLRITLTGPHPERHWSINEIAILN